MSFSFGHALKAQMIEEIKYRRAAFLLLLINTVESLSVTAWNSEIMLDGKLSVARFDLFLRQLNFSEKFGIKQKEPIKSCITIYMIGAVHQILHHNIFCSAKTMHEQTLLG